VAAAIYTLVEVRHQQKERHYRPKTCPVTTKPGGKTKHTKPIGTERQTDREDGGGGGLIFSSQLLTVIVKHDETCATAATSAETCKWRNSDS
jgi:hypothetical protein